jgi:hypothetical protein
MRLVHAMVAAAGTATIVLSGAAPAFAAAPSNDTIGGATVIGAVPFSETVDTTEATTDAEDAAINSQCGAPATNGSVWYQVTAAEAGYLVDVSQSNFSAGVIVATGTPGRLAIRAASASQRTPVRRTTSWPSATSRPWSAAS